MKSFSKLVTFFLGGIVMSQVAVAQTPNAATDPRIDPQVRSFLAELNKDSSLFWNYRSPSRKRSLPGSRTRRRSTCPE